MKGPLNLRIPPRIGHRHASVEGMAIDGWSIRIAIGLISLLIYGCGTTKSFTATEQLLMSDAVDSTISKMDFSPLSGFKVYLDTTYVVAAGKVIPGTQMTPNLINSDYVISALRQQLTASGCMLVDARDNADVICEARCGALGTDGHSITYGLPASNLLSSASVVIPGSPSIPTIPELSVAKREMKSAAAKVAVFAYDRESREPVWQSGVTQAGSNARDTWILGVGPLQYGSIYPGTRFAGRRLRNALLMRHDEPKVVHRFGGVDHRGRHLFASRLFEPKPVPETAAVENELADESVDRGSTTIKRTDQSLSPTPNVVR